jgi:hypothetical protein
MTTPWGGTPANVPHNLRLGGEGGNRWKDPAERIQPGW